jgi:hypothetical protein
MLVQCGDSKPAVKYDPDRKEQEKHPQPDPEPTSVPQAGVDALKDIKKIKKQEDEKLKEDQKTLQQIDNAH